jgi:DNA repair protein RAD5
LRRAVLHPSLVLSADEDSGVTADDGSVDVDAMIRQFQAEEPDGPASKVNTFAEDVLTNLSGETGTECPICMDVCETMVIIPGCMHRW